MFFKGNVTKCYVHSFKCLETKPKCVDTLKNVTFKYIFNELIKLTMFKRILSNFFSFFKVKVSNIGCVEKFLAYLILK